MGSTDATLANISVGSEIIATGQAGEASLDASNGLVRILPTRLSGTVVSTSPLSMDISLINGRRASLFDFSGTGTSSESDADRDNYELFTGSLDLSDMTPGSPAKARGYVQDFGAAPEDFNAHTVIDASEVRAHMVATYGIEGSSSAITSATEEGIQISVDNASQRSAIVRAGIPTRLQDMESVPLFNLEESEVSIQFGKRAHPKSILSTQIFSLLYKMNLWKALCLFALMHTEISMKAHKRLVRAESDLF